MGNNIMYDDFDNDKKDDKDENLTATDEYFQMQEAEEIKKSNVVPINPGITPEDLPVNIWEKAKTILNEEKRIAFLKAEIEKAQLEYGFPDDDINVPLNWAFDQPQPIKYIIDEFLPENVVGILGAKGGTGKSMVCMQLAIAIAAGCGGEEFFGLNVNQNGKVLFLSGEDTREMCRQRIYNIRCAYENAKNAPVIDWNLIDENLKIKSFVGENVKLTVKEGNSPATPVKQTVDIIANTAKRLPNCKLVIIDTYSRFNGGSENSNEDAATFINACEMIMKKAGVGVLVLAHMRKDQNNTAESESIAGGARFVDSARWAATMTPYLAKQYEALGMEEEEALSHIQFRVGKDNYSGKLGKSIYMKRGAGGVILPHPKINEEKGPVGRPNAPADIRVNPAYRSLRNNLIDIIGRHQNDSKPVTRSQIKTRYCGTSHGQVGASWAIVNRVLSAMIDDFDVALRSLGPGKGEALFLRRKNG